MKVNYCGSSFIFSDDSFPAPYIFRSVLLGQLRKTNANGEPQVDDLFTVLKVGEKSSYVAHTSVWDPQVLA